VTRPFEGIVYCPGCHLELKVEVHEDNSWTYDHPEPGCQEWDSAEAAPVEAN
jgi:hypothetical protein